jgi:hypothetical protein
MNPFLYTIAFRYLWFDKNVDVRVVDNKSLTMNPFLYTIAFRYLWFDKNVDVRVVNKWKAPLINPFKPLIRCTK